MKTKLRWWFTFRISSTSFLWVREYFSHLFAPFPHLDSHIHIYRVDDSDGYRLRTRDKRWQKNVKKKRRKKQQIKNYCLIIRSLRFVTGVTKFFSLLVYVRPSKFITLPRERQQNYFYGLELFFGKKFNKFWIFVECEKLVNYQETF